MKIVEKIAVTILRYRYRRCSKKILKIRSQIGLLVFHPAYVKAISLFPDDALNDNINLANEAVSNFYVSNKGKIKETGNRKVKRLRKDMLSDKNTMEALSNYHLATHFYYSFHTKNKKDNPYLKEATDALGRAKSYKSTAKPITAKSLEKIQRQMKKELKVIRKSFAKIKAEKLESERTKIVVPMKIHASTIFSYVSVFSSFVLLFGFAYTYILLWFLDIDASDFFNITDYLSSNIGRIFLAATTACIVALMWSLKISSLLKEEIVHDQFQTSKKKSKFESFERPLVALGIVAIVFMNWYAHDIFLGFLLYPVIFWLLIIIVFDFLKIDQYVENKISFSIATLAFIMVTTYLGGHITDTVYDIKTGVYKSEYDVTFKKEYENYAMHDFFMANSEYVFLLEKETNKIVVIPKDAIKEMRPKSD